MISRAASPSTRPARVALLGCGTVGREVAARLLAGSSRCSEGGSVGGVTLEKILVRDPSRRRTLPAHDRSLFTDSFDEVLDAGPDLIIELLGGLDPAAAYAAHALARGIPVATANKTVLAHRGGELDHLARRSGAALAFEGTVCAGLPLLATLEQLRGDQILSIRGIISGSCNFILTRLAAGITFDSAVKEAQARGLVEPDPSADLSGRDAAEKACILAAAAGWPGITPDRVEREGIERLTAEDLAAARRTGHTIKLLAELDFSGPAPTLRVGPTLVPLTHPLASVHLEENAVLITAALAGDIFLRGRGAGPAPTASAVLGDVVRLLGRRVGNGDRPASSRETPPRAEVRREYLLCAAGTGGGPGSIFAAAERHGLHVRDVAVGQRVAHVLAGAATVEQARACAAAMATSFGGGLVIPAMLADEGPRGA